MMPSDEEMLDRQARQARQEGISLMPPEAMLEMKAVISLPSQEQEPFEDIYFIEPPVHRIQECIDQINRFVFKIFLFILLDITKKQDRGSRRSTEGDVLR